jgi:serine/threonine-protein phosphatase 2A regulatory subunit B'
MLLNYSWVRRLESACTSLYLQDTEVNPQLFDDCSHEYTQQQNALAEKQNARKQRWERLEQLAKAKKASTSSGEAPASSAAVADEASDPSENQRRMEALRLQDDPHRSSAPVSTDKPAHV